MVVSTAKGIGHPPLLMLLADGQLHSGEWLAEQMGVSPVDVHQQVQRLSAFGLDLALKGQGYQLARSVELLDVGDILAAFGTQALARTPQIEILFEVGSTNSRLLSSESPPRGCMKVCLTELQTAGRGRRGRPWLAPFGGSIALSVGWNFGNSARALPCLSLSIGVAIARALRRVGGRGIALKWPNDIWFADRKIGGVLIELKTEASGPVYVVIGVGINLWLDEAMRQAIEASGVRVATVSDACRMPPSRNHLVGILLDEILGVLEQFERAGFAPLRLDWEALDALRGRTAQVLVGERIIEGTASGIDDEGALMLQIDGHCQKFLSGEVSLRLP